jgi:nitrogen fixation protein FixH
MTGTEREFTGWHMAIIMVAFFGVVIGVNLTMAILASGSWTGLIVRNSYVASQEFNGKLAEADAQIALGWRGGFDYADGEIRFRLTDADGSPVIVNSTLVTLSRPAHENADHSVPLIAHPDGGLNVAHVLAPGAWIARVEVRGVEGHAYRKAFRFVVPAPEKAR